MDVMRECVRANEELIDARLCEVAAPIARQRSVRARGRMGSVGLLLRGQDERLYLVPWSNVEWAAYAPEAPAHEAPEADEQPAVEAAGPEAPESAPAEADDAPAPAGPAQAKRRRSS